MKPEIIQTKSFPYVFRVDHTCIPNTPMFVVACTMDEVIEWFNKTKCTMNYPHSNIEKIERLGVLYGTTLEEDVQHYVYW